MVSFGQVDAKPEFIAIVATAFSPTQWRTDLAEQAQHGRSCAIESRADIKRLAAMPDEINPEDFASLKTRFAEILEVMAFAFDAHAVFFETIAAALVIPNPNSGK